MMTVEKTETPGEMLQRLGVDARVWTDEFLKTFPGGMPDRETLIGWFANAIMAGWDAKAKADRESSEIDKLIVALEKAVTELRPPAPPQKSMRGFMIPQSVLVDAITEGMELDRDIIVEVDLAGRITVTLPNSVNDVLKRIHPKPVER